MLAYGGGLILVLAVLVVLGGVGLVLHGPFELGGRVAAHETSALGRPVTIGSLQVRLGSPVTVTVRDLSIANAPGLGPGPFLTLGSLDAEVTPWSLVGWLVLGHGPVVRQLAVEDVAVSMAHGADDRPNWRFDGTKTTRDPRIGFPTLLNARFQAVAVDFHTSSGKLLKIRADGATIAAAASDQPITLAVRGSYNGFPVRLDAPLGSFDQFHDAGRPFPADVQMASEETQVHVKGTLTRPLAADGIVGEITIQAPSPDRLLAMIGVRGHAAMPLTLSAGLTRETELWRLTDGKGTLDASPFTLTTQVHEGVRHAPDAFTVDAGFQTLDLAKIGGQDTLGETLLRIDDAPGTVLDAHLTARHMADGALQADNVDIKTTLAPGAFGLAPLTMRVAGGLVRLDMAIKNGAGESATVRGDASLSGGDPAQLSRLMGLGDLPITGPVDVRAGFDSTAVRASDAGHDITGGLVLSMTGGTVARSLLEKASTDVRALFRDADGVGRIACLLGVVELDAGTGRMAPLRLKTTAGTLIGEGTLDLRRDRIDVSFATEGATTSAFALDVPVRLFGPIRDPQVLPSAVRPGNGGDLGKLAPALLQFAQANPCANR